MTRLDVEHRPSANHGERRAAAIDILLLHYTGMPDHDQALAWLCRGDSEVSSHYFVHEDGRTVSLVAEDRRAWHAGASSWAGQDDVNSRSIGIEIANVGHPGGLPGYPDPQVEAVIALCRDILDRHSIPPHRVLGHSDVAPGRKLDPGERFPWDRLAASGVGHWIKPAEITGGAFLSRGDLGEPVEALQAMLALYGYAIEVTGSYDERLEAVVAAFQRHFRPARVDGIADRSTIATLRDLLTALP